MFLSLSSLDKILRGMSFRGTVDERFFETTKFDFKLSLLIFRRVCFCDDGIEVEIGMSDSKLVEGLNDFK